MITSNKRGADWLALTGTTLGLMDEKSRRRAISQGFMFHLAGYPVEVFG
jgi:hypothetical protein